MILRCLEVSVVWKFVRPASWSSSNAFFSVAEGLRFESRAGQIGHNVANGQPRCDISSKGAVLPGRNDAEMGLVNSLHALACYSECNERFDLI